MGLPWRPEKPDAVFKTLLPGYGHVPRTNTATETTRRLPTHLTQPRPEDPDAQSFWVPARPRGGPSRRIGASAVVVAPHRATIASGTRRWQHWRARWHNGLGGANGDARAARNPPPCRIGPSEGQQLWAISQAPGHFEAALLGSSAPLLDGGDQWRKRGGGVCQFLILFSWLMAGSNAERRS